jgi:hypothetical protein
MGRATSSGGKFGGGRWICACYIYISLDAGGERNTRQGAVTWAKMEGEARLGARRGVVKLGAGRAARGAPDICMRRLKRGKGT